MLTEVAPQRYIIKVNGIQVGKPQPTMHLAELQLMGLPEDQRILAEIVAITADGKSLLLG